ncbi:MAG: hypothetical protein R3E79_58840 [Caldilineaceae bacterium]
MTVYLLAFLTKRFVFVNCRLSPYKRGRPFHYIANPDSKSGATITPGVMRRLEEIGFQRISRRRKRSAVAPNLKYTPIFVLYQPGTIMLY